MAISKLKTGDKVQATDTKTGKTSAQTVAAVLVHHDTNLYDLRVHTADGSAVIETTRSHLFWDQDSRRWLKAGALRHGTHLRTAGGGTSTVTGGWTPRHHDSWMWDLTITSDHDFYIQAASTAVLVHNCPIEGVPPGKTVAAAGQSRTLSGWGPGPEGFSRVNPREVLDLQREMGFPARPAGFLDGGTPGQFFASHAERQIALLEPNTPIEVSQEMCADCRAFFQRLA